MHCMVCGQCTNIGLLMFQIGRIILFQLDLAFSPLNMVIKHEHIPINT